VNDEIPFFLIVLVFFFKKVLLPGMAVRTNGLEVIGSYFSPFTRVLCILSLLSRHCHIYVTLWILKNCCGS
jgi:succinate dehydrogenase hydrophobic anchor subunit